DGTREKLEELRSLAPERVEVLALRANVGKAEAVRAGVLRALDRGAAYVGFWDADLATPLAVVNEFRARLAARCELELVMGARIALLGRRIARRALRHYAGRAFATGASLALALPVYDTQCGAKLWRVLPHTRELFERPFAGRWTFDVELLARRRELERSRGL